MASDILIVDDEADIRSLIAGILEDEGYETRIAANSAEAFEAIGLRQPNLIILDVWLQNSQHDGLEMLEIIRRENPDQQVVMISGHATFDMAVSATKRGAYDFLSKPIKMDVLLHTVERAVEDARLRLENRELRAISGGPDELVGASSAMVQTRQAIAKLAQSDSRVLISGPAGVGKTAIAGMIHQHSRRNWRPLVALSCSAIGADRLEEALFGIEATATSPRRIGVFEQAHGGTLLLDDVGDLSPEMQSRLVRVLHRPQFSRVNGKTLVEVDVRVLAATNRDLLDEITAGRFREDLFHRLNVVPMYVPPLAERREDIPLLAQHFMMRAALSRKRPPRAFAADGLAALQAHDWPGNAWELGNVVERLLMFGREDQFAPVTGEAVVHVIGEASDDVARWDRLLEVMNQPLREARGSFEAEYLRFHLTRFGGNISKTAEFVGMDRAALHRKLKGLGVGSVSRLPRNGEWAGRDIE